MAEPVVIRIWGPDRRLLFPFSFPSIIRTLPVISVIASTAFLVLKTPSLPLAWSPFQTLLLVSAGALFGLLLVAIFAMVFAQVPNLDIESSALHSAVVIDWRYVPLAVALLTLWVIFANAGPVLSILGALLRPGA